MLLSPEKKTVSHKKLFVLQETFSELQKYVNSNWCVFT